MVGVFAARPEANGQGEVLPVHLATARTIRQKQRQEIRIVGPVKAADLLAELVFGDAPLAQNDGWVPFSNEGFENMDLGKDGWGL